MSRVVVRKSVDIDESASGGGGGAAADFTEDFSSYADTAEFHTDPNGWYGTMNDTADGGASGAVATQDIVTNVTDPEASSNQTLRQQFNHGSDGCTTIHIRNTIQPSSIFGGGGIKEIWTEWRILYSTNFRTSQSTCSPNDHKLIFGETAASENRRWAIYVGKDSPDDHNFAAQTPYPEPGEEYWNQMIERGGSQPNIYPGPAASVDSENPGAAWDGNWHTLRWHLKCSTTATSEDGEVRIWWDGTLYHLKTGFNVSASDDVTDDTITGFTFTLTQNDGPVNEDMYIWFGPIKFWTSDPGWT